MGKAGIILVAVGANLPGPWGERPVDACRRAALEIGLLPGLELIAVSPWYRTTPVPRSAQPDYANGLVRLRGDVGAEQLLAGLQAIERQAGRQRSVPDAARTLDLDIIDMGGLVRPGPDPILPHPRAAERAFVLLPLRDVAPDWVHPCSGRSVGALLAGLQSAVMHGCGDAGEPLDWPAPYK